MRIKKTKSDLFSIDLLCIALGGLIRIAYCIKYPVPVRDAFKYKDFIEAWNRSGFIPYDTYYPPLSMFLLKVPNTIFGYDVIKGGTIFNNVLGLGIIIALIRVSYEIFPSRIVALCSGLFVATHPSFVQYSCQMTRENSYLLFSCLAILFFIKSLHRPGKTYFIVCAAFFSSCAFLCRFEALELFVLFLLLIIHSNLKPISACVKKVFLFTSFSIISLGSIIYFINIPFSYFLSHQYLLKFDFILK